MPTLTINRSALNTLLDHVSTTETRVRAEKVRQRAEQIAPSRTGKLARSTEVQQDGTAHRVIATAPYSGAVERGAAPHVIRATNATALVFNWENRGGVKTVVPRDGYPWTGFTKGGVLVIGKGFVEHPGTEPTHFLLNALHDVMGG